MTQYLALLRGINVGGKNIIKMSDLKDCFRNLGFTDISTYIQSGNIIFKSSENDRRKLIAQIEKELTRQFNYKAKVVIISHRQLELIINEAPPEFGILPDKFKYDVIFLRDGLSSDELIGKIKVRENVDSAKAGKYCLYFSRLTSKLTQSKLKNVMSLPEYQEMTIRNWNTTKKILLVMDKNDHINA